MKRVLAVAIVVSVWAGIVGVAHGQNPMPGPANPAQQSTVVGYNSLYCAGFITDRNIQEGLYITAGAEGGIKNEFIPGDIVYLNRGAGWIVNPSGEYMVLRRTRDIQMQEIFPRQRMMMEQLGTVYKEVGRIKVNIVHELSATAQVLQACDSITVGDIVIPFNVKAAPPLKPSVGFDRFAPPTGKTGGTIVASKEFLITLRTGETAYLNIGSKDGVTVGQYYRVYRPFENSSRDPVRRYAQLVPEKVMGLRLGKRLTLAEQAGLPRDVLGEMVILHVEGRSATALITFSLREIFVGDQVELE